MPERMDRRQLREARRVIARLVRKKAVTRRTKEKPAEPVAAQPVRPGGYRQTIHLGVDATVLANLDAIVEYMKTRPDIACLQADLGREKAARFAITQLAKRLSARITQTG